MLAVLVFLGICQLLVAGLLYGLPNSSRVIGTWLPSIQALQIAGLIGL